MKPIEFSNGVLRLLDQTRLPLDCSYVECSSCSETAEAIKNMIVRGAPAIGVTAAYGLAIEAAGTDSCNYSDFLHKLESAGDMLKSARPTAVNLSWAVDRILKMVRTHPDRDTGFLKRIVLDEARKIDEEDIMTNKTLGKNGQILLDDGDTVLTHCNAGALATSGYGTALGVIRTACEQGKSISVIADETRPYLQGARLTAWELMEDSIPVTLICDNMAGHLMKLSKIDCVIVGADRIASNGDTANKIGTYSLAVLARENNIPFYVAAPVSTIDFNIDSGDDIPIEERSPDEVTHLKGMRIAPPDVNVLNPAFDVTPARLISAIITERGVFYPPYEESLRGPAF